MLAAASTWYVRRESNSYPAHEVHNEKNKQKGSKNAATNIHLILRLTYEAVLDAESVSAVWAVPHHRGVVEIGGLMLRRPCQAASRPAMPRSNAILAT
jgi:hypothetical protein